MNSKSVLRTVAAALAVSLTMIPLTAAAPKPSPRVTVMVDTAENVAAEEILSAIGEAELLYEYDLIDAFAASVPENRLGALQSAPGVLSVTEEAVFTAPTAARGRTFGDKDIDPRDGVIRAERADTGAGSVIAILDTGFNVEHPSFAVPDSFTGKIAREDLPDLLRTSYAIFHVGEENIESTFVSPKIPFAYDYGDEDTDVICTSTHGTHVAATAAGCGELYGTAPGAQLLLMKVFDENGSCRETVLVKAMEDAIKLGADVINLSLGSLALSSTVVSMGRLAQTIRSARNRGVSVICAVGNDGRAGAMGLYSDTFRASDPDYGLPSEPAVLDSAIAVGAAVNQIVYAGYIEVSGRKIVYDPSDESANHRLPTLSEVLGGKTASLAVVGGMGRAEDYDNLTVQGRIVLIRRGEITFEEKIKTAAAHGAIAAIVYDPQNDGEAFLMSVGADSPIPAVSVGRMDGIFLSMQNGRTVTVSKKEGAFPSGSRGVASYSSYGPTSDLVLKPDIAAVGSYVISASVDGGYTVMTGTSMAAPQIAGMTAAFMALNRDILDTVDPAQRSAFVKMCMMSSAEPMRDASGTPYSPRGQGAGALRVVPDSVFMMSEDGRGSITLGDGNTGEFSLSLVLLNTGTEETTLRLRCETITDGSVEIDGVHYSTYLPEKVPALTRVELNEHIFLDGESGDILCTLQGGEKTAVRLDVTVDPAYMESHGAIFENGFYLEGYVVAEETDGTHVASLPFLSFAGDWEGAPLTDGGDWDGYESFYGGQHIYLDGEDAAYCAGETGAGILSELFMFSPDGDGVADSLFISLKPLRHISAFEVEVENAAGEIIFRDEGPSIPKGYVDEGLLTPTMLPLWDGSDGFNENFIWEDGEYTVRLILISFGGRREILEIPMTVDTVKPTVKCTVSGGKITARAEDNGYLKELRIYLPTGEDAYALNEILTPAYDPDVHTASLSAAWPKGAEYVYIRAEDYAGNVTVYRQYGN